jgi:hypothetical protein
MLLDNWKALAIGLAAYAREFLPDVRRGALALRLPLGVGYVAGAFGNDGYAEDSRARTEVAALRERLQQAGLEELSFGLSKDGHTWALLVGPGRSQQQTPDDGIPAEALVAFVDDAVWDAWKIACGLPPLETSAGGSYPTLADETAAGVR